MIANGRTERDSLMPLCRRRWRQRTDDKRPRLNTKKGDKEGLRKNYQHIYIYKLKKEREQKRKKNECYNWNGTNIE